LIDCFQKQYHQVPDMVLMSNAFYGEASSGNWTIKVIDAMGNYAGSLAGCHAGNDRSLWPQPIGYDQSGDRPRGEVTTNSTGIKLPYLWCCYVASYGE
jgi:hypothetical protein